MFGRRRFNSYNRERQGCLQGLFQLFMLTQIFEWLQGRFGTRSSNPCGCGCGCVFLVIFLCLAASIMCNTNWFQVF